MIGALSVSVPVSAIATLQQRTTIGLVLLGVIIMIAGVILALLFASAIVSTLQRAAQQVSDSSERINGIAAQQAGGAAQQVWAVNAINKALQNFTEMARDISLRTDQLALMGNQVIQRRGEIAPAQIDSILAYITRSVRDISVASRQQAVQYERMGRRDAGGHRDRGSGRQQFAAEHGERRAARPCRRSSCNNWSAFSAARHGWAVACSALRTELAAQFDAAPGWVPNMPTCRWRPNVPPGERACLCAPCAPRCRRARAAPYGAQPPYGAPAPYGGSRPYGRSRSLRRPGRPAGLRRSRTLRRPAALSRCQPPAGAPGYGARGSAQLWRPGMPGYGAPAPMTGGRPGSRPGGPMPDGVGGRGARPASDSDMGRMPFGERAPASGGVPGGVPGGGRMPLPPLPVDPRMPPPAPGRMPAGQGAGSGVYPRPANPDNAGQGWNEPGWEDYRRSPRSRADPGNGDGQRETSARGVRVVRARHALHPQPNGPGA